VDRFEPNLRIPGPTALPPSVRDHLVCRVADQLTPVTQKHDIEGLVMGVD